MDNSHGGTSTADYAYAAANRARDGIEALDARMTAIEVMLGISPCPYPEAPPRSHAQSFLERYRAFITVDELEKLSAAHIPSDSPIDPRITR
jgi:hypothetical protein